MAVLYRKYRPQTFSEVLNQKYIVQTLKNQVASGQVSHAYLFTGSRGVGKTSLARILAKAVNCPNVKDGEPCGQCEFCTQIANNTFLDLLEIDAASNTGVDNIRELIEHVKFSPSLGKYKVFIIDEVHMLSKGAFNALLKTLEEPPKHAIFVLATTEINKVPATIISRTQRFDFKAYSAGDLFQLLEKIGVAEKFKLSPEILQLVAQNAEGSARDALSILDKVMTLGENPSLDDCQQLLGITDIATCENLLEIIALGDQQSIPRFYNQLSERGLDYAILNRDFLEFLRKVLIYKITGGQTELGLQEERQNKIAALAEKLSTQEIVFIIRLFLKSYKDLAQSPSPQISLLIASIEAALRKTTPAIQKPLGPAPAAVSQPVNFPKTTNPPKVSSGPEIVEELVMGLDEAKSLWPGVVAKVKELNSPLASLLKNSQPVEVKGSKIVLSVKFKFDKQSLESQKNASLISSVILGATGKQIQISAQVVSVEAPSAGNPAEVISEALKVFGGELVE